MSVCASSTCYIIGESVCFSLLFQIRLYIIIIIIYVYAVILALFYVLCTYWIWHEKNCTSLKYRFKRYFRGGIYCIILYSLYGSIYTYLYNVYYKAIRIIDASCLRNTAYKSLHINVQFLVNICWRVKAINNVMNTRYIYIYTHILQCSSFPNFLCLFTGTLI